MPNVRVLPLADSATESHDPLNPNFLAISSNESSLPIVAQALQIENGQTAIFEP
jgi:hypothetical protein